MSHFPPFQRQCKEKSVTSKDIEALPPPPLPFFAPLRLGRWQHLSVGAPPDAFSFVLSGCRGGTFFFFFRLAYICVNHPHNNAELIRNKKGDSFDYLWLSCHTYLKCFATQESDSTVLDQPVCVCTHFMINSSRLGAPQSWPKTQNDIRICDAIKVNWLPNLDQETTTASCSTLFCFKKNSDNAANNNLLKNKWNINHTYHSYQQDFNA